MAYYHPERVPGAESAEAADEKFTLYLLNPDHAAGGPKSRLFARLGFDLANWEELRDAILYRLPFVSGHFSRLNLANGENWIATMRIEGPTGSADIVTTWAVNPGRPTWFVTAYPDD